MFFFRFIGLGKLTVADVEPALTFCTHLVYGFAGNSHKSILYIFNIQFNRTYRIVGINAVDNKLQSLNVGLDLDQGKGHYRIITQLKRKNPGLKVILSVGGGLDNDPEAETNKYVS